MGNRRVVIDGHSECGRELVSTGIRRRNGEVEGQRLVGRIGMIEIAKQHEIVGSGAVIRQRNFEHLVSLGAAVTLVGSQNSATIRQNILNGNTVRECRLCRLNCSKCQRPVAQAGGQILRPADGIGGIGIIPEVGTPIDSEVACRCQECRLGRCAFGQIVFIDGRARGFRDKRSVVCASDGDGHGLDGRQDAVIDPDVEGQCDGFAVRKEIHGLIVDEIGPVDRSARFRCRFNGDAASRIQAEAGQQRIELGIRQGCAAIDGLGNHRTCRDFSGTGFAEIRIEEGNRSCGGFRVGINAARDIVRFDDLAGNIATSEPGNHIADILNFSAFAAAFGKRCIPQKTQGLETVTGDRGTA